MTSDLRSAVGVGALAVAILASCTGGDSSPGGVQPRPSSAESHNSAAGRLLDDVAPCGRAFVCGVLEVPLDRASGQGTLRLPVGARGRVDAPRGVLLVLAGGPGQAGVALKERIVATVGLEVARAYRIVVLDQRGTGPTALQCPALQRAMGFSDLTPPPATAVRDCTRRLGPDRELYSTDDVVADLDQLRSTLGADRMTLYGTSYGTFVAEHYALSHPEHTAALVLDSVVPHAGIDPLAVDVFAAVRRVLPAACAAVSCPSDPVHDIATVIARGYDGPALLDLLTMVSIVDPTFESLLGALRSAAAGSTGALDEMVRGYREGFQGPADVLSQGLHASALCSDSTFPWGTSAAPLDERETAVQQAVNSVPQPQLSPFDDRTAAGNGFIRQCLPWAPLPDAPLRRRGALPDVPTLLLAGTHDLSTPLEWARREARLAPSGQLLVVEGAGHSVARRGGRGRAGLRSFLLR
jgi:pimeloyl-ACP methyl ester carboxylesterase